MNPINQLEQGVRALSRPEFDAFKLWLVDYENELWSGQIEQDSYDVNSPIMKMAAEALVEHKKRNTRTL